MLRHPGENLWALIASLAEKAEQDGADFTDEIAALETSLTRQQEILSSLNAQLGGDLDEIARQLNDVLE